MGVLCVSSLRNQLYNQPVATSLLRASVYTQTPLLKLEYGAPSRQMNDNTRPLVPK